MALLGMTRMGTAVSWDRTVPAAGAAAIAGAVVGVVVGGLGSRLAMRVAGAMADTPAVLRRTENGNVVGVFTIEGTVALMLFAGLFPGIVIGAAFAAARPWLVPFGRWAGLAYGIVLLATLGSLVLQPFNLDFQRFGEPALNVAMFALLFPLFGVAMGFALPFFERRIRGARAGSPWSVAAVLGALVLAGFVVPVVMTLIGTATTGGDLIAAGGTTLYLLGVPVALRFVLGRGAPVDDLTGLGRPLVALSYALLLVPAIVLAPQTIDAITFLAR